MTKRKRGRPKTDKHKVKITITLDEDLSKELDAEVKSGTFRNKSHAVEKYIKRGKR